MFLRMGIVSQGLGQERLDVGSQGVGPEGDSLCLETEIRADLVAHPLAPAGWYRELRWLVS